MSGRAIDAYLHKLWRRLRNDAGPAEVEYVRGAIDALYAANVLTTDARELWTRRIEVCPGHDDEGGRSWCAFCGDLPQEADALPSDPA